MNTDIFTPDGRVDGVKVGLMLLPNTISLSASLGYNPPADVQEIDTPEPVLQEAPAPVFLPQESPAVRVGL